MASYLGIDAGTQSLKAVLIGNGEILAETSVHFGRDLPQYGAPNGFIPDDNPAVRQADPRMWNEAMELALQRLAKTGARLEDVSGISGSGQQHGSVYLDRDGELSRPTSPIWMDRSTSAECRELAEHFGPRVQMDTGSPPIERFTGPQIRKFFKDDPKAYARTSRIHLVSSYLCSLLIGTDAPIDIGDGAGMNLLNLRTLTWDPELVEFTAPGLIEKLPRPVSGNTIAGGLAPRFARYGLKPGTPVAVWSGDNPNSLIGTGAADPGMAVVSLGTSDTFFAAMPAFRTDPEGYGHVFGNPAGGFMSLICFTNGSPAREKVKEACGVDWDFFDHEALRQTQFGNDGRLMLPYFVPESTPLVLKPGVVCNFTDSTPAERIRALLESQALSMRSHSAWQGQTFTRIRITGGASQSESIRQLLADVFQSRVETIQVTNSAALGAALRAANAVEGVSFAELSKLYCCPASVVEPDPAKREQADAMLEAFTAFENRQLSAPRLLQRPAPCRLYQVPRGSGAARRC